MGSLYRIKPLEWRDNNWNGELADPFGVYTYHVTKQNEWAFTRSHVSGHPEWHKAVSQEAAKAACQAHYEELLLSVLERAE